MHSVKHGSRLSHDIMKIKLCVVSIGVHLEAMSLSYSDDVSGVKNKEQRTKDASLGYTTKDTY